MIRKAINQKGLINKNDSSEGETIETKIERITTTKEPITDGAPLIYTDRKEGTRPEYDIRTDRFDLALDAMDTVTKVTMAKRAEFYKKEGVPDGTTEGKA